MKKIFSITLMALFVAGCGGGDGTEDDLQDVEDKPTETTNEEDMEESTDEPDAD